jgi:crooked neck
VQITAEQLLQEAHERLEGDEFAPKKSSFIGREDMGEFKQRSRAQFEDKIRRNRTAIGNYLKYAKFEESINEWARARSIYERALDVEPRNVVIWLKYAEMEMGQKNVNLARNVWNRAVTMLPRIDQLWYKYAYMEAVWFSFIKFESRYKEWDLVRRLYARLLGVHSSVNNWLKWAEFEESHGSPFEARAVLERAMDILDDSPEAEPRLFIAFAKFETRQREIDRARAIYRLGLERFPAHLAPALQHAYAQFEREWGDSTAAIDSVVLAKRRSQYAAQAEVEPLNYDNWFDWIHLEEELLSAVSGDDSYAQLQRTAQIAVIREVFERAIGQMPPSQDEKRFWRRYIYLWLFYAIFEEDTVGDRPRALEVLTTAVRLIPHGQFTFTKLWNHLALFHIRGGDLAAARKTFGQAIGMSTCNGKKRPKASLFTRYIQLEMDLREFDRVRQLYQRFLSLDPTRALTWSRFAELERLLLDDERARALYALAMDLSDQLERPELIWKDAIDFEFENGEYDSVRSLYDQLLERTSCHLKIWVSYASMEASLAQVQEDGDPDAMPRARAVLQRGYDHFKTQGLNAERLVLLEAWKELEAMHGTAADVEAVRARLPRRVKKRRRVLDAEEGEAVWEEFYDYVFPDDEAAAASQTRGHLKLLELARQWKQKTSANEQ